MNRTRCATQKLEIIVGYAKKKDGIFFDSTRLSFDASKLLGIFHCGCPAIACNAHLFIRYTLKLL